MTSDLIHKIEETDREYWKLKSENVKGLNIRQKYDFIQNNLSEYYNLRTSPAYNLNSHKWIEFYNLFGKLSFKCKTSDKQKRLFMRIGRNVDLDKRIAWVSLSHHDDPYNILPLGFNLFTAITEESRLTEFSIEMNRFFADPITLKETLENDPNNKSNLPILIPAPWEHQDFAISLWQQHQGRGLIEMATGTGKTLAAFLAIEKIAIEMNKPPRVVVVSHTLVLLDQWKEHFHKAFGFRDEAKWFQVKTAMGLLNVDINKIQCDFLIVDEIHQLLGPQFQRALQIPAKYRLGLTATIKPNTLGLIEKNIGKKVFSYTLKKAIEDGIIVPFKFKIYIVKLTNDEQQNFDKFSRQLAQLFTKAKSQGISSLPKYCSAQKNNSLCKDYWQLVNLQRTVIHEAVSKEHETIELLKIYGLNKKVIVFFERIQTMEKISSELTNSGVNLYKVHSDMNKNRIKNEFEVFKKAKTGILLGAKMINAGIDIPDADIGINAQFEKGRIQLIQRIGRLARKSLEKPDKRPEFHHIIAVPQDNFIENDEVQSVYLFSRLIGVDIEFFDKTDSTPLNSAEIIQALKSKLNITDRILNDPIPDERIEAINQITQRNNSWHINSLIIAKWCDENDSVRNAARERFCQLC